MGLEMFPSVEDLTALMFCFILDFGVGWVTGGMRWSLGRFVALLGTFPRFSLPMHSIFVAFPVVFAAEAAGTGGVGAAVGAGVSFSMFSRNTTSISQRVVTRNTQMDRSER